MLNGFAKHYVDLTNPENETSKIILYIYSMELGSPPLYSEINRVCRDMDESQLTTLGPYIRALGIVTAFSERNKKE